MFSADRRVPDLISESLSDKENGRQLTTNLASPVSSGTVPQTTGVAALETCERGVADLPSLRCPRPMGCPSGIPLSRVSCT